MGSQFVQTARRLYASTMYPFSALQLTLLDWQIDEQADQELSDSDTEEDNSPGGNDTAQPSVRYQSEEDYNACVCLLVSLSLPLMPLHTYWPYRRVEKINAHYAWLGVELLFKRLPTLEPWLTESYDDGFVTEVGPFPNTPGAGFEVM